MKLIHYLTALLTALFITLNAFAQESQPQVSTGLAGVWQMCLSDPASVEGSAPRTAPFLKIFGKNGELTNLVVGGTSVMTATGVYAQESDSTYTETMSYATFAPLIGRPNLMTFKLVEDKYLYLQFRVEGAPNSNLLKEIWVRVTPPSAEATKQRPALPRDRREDGVYIVADVMPEYPGGMEGLMQFLSANLKYPKEASEKNIGGRVIVQFVIDAEGKLTVPKIVRGGHPLLDAEALRVVATMPHWTPGRVDDKPVPVLFTVPINFSSPAVPKTNPLIAAH